VPFPIQPLRSRSTPASCRGLRGIARSQAFESRSPIQHGYIYIRTVTYHAKEFHPFSDAGLVSPSRRLLVVASSDSGVPPLRRCRLPEIICQRRQILRTHLHLSIRVELVVRSHRPVRRNSTVPFCVRMAGVVWQARTPVSETENAAPRMPPK
jgi:hypothetical protein